jgi:hypothetical protein
MKRLLSAFAALATVALLGAPAPAAAQVPDTLTVVIAFENALLARNVEAAVALFADDAVIITPAGNEIRGREPIRAYLAQLVAQNVDFQLVGERRVTGEREQHTALFSIDDWRRLGIAPLEVTADITVRGGLIRSFATALTPSSQAKLLTATALSRLPAPAGPLPTALPRTGSPAAFPALLLSLGVLVIATGAAMRRIRS